MTVDDDNGEDNNDHTDEDKAVRPMTMSMKAEMVTVIAMTAITKPVMATLFLFVVTLTLRISVNSNDCCRCVNPNVTYVP